MTDVSAYQLFVILFFVPSFNESQFPSYTSQELSVLIDGSFCEYDHFLMGKTQSRNISEQVFKKWK